MSDVVFTEQERHELGRLRHTVFGNGQPGMDDRLRSVERYMFANPDTGEPGLVGNVIDLSKKMDKLATVLITLNWLLGFVGTGGLIALLRWLALG